MIGILGFVYQPEPVAELAVRLAMRFLRGEPGSLQIADLGFEMDRHFLLNFSKLVLLAPKAMA